MGEPSRYVARPRQRLIFAVDAPSTAAAAPLVERLAPHIGMLKIGLELFSREGPAAVTWASGRGLEVFLDLKLHDIPETVGRAVAAIADTGARIATVHAAGGAAMLQRAVDRARGSQLLVAAVTVLTSLDAHDLAVQGLSAEPLDQATRLARLAWSVGVRAFVCSPAEARALRSALGPEAVLITPGIRPTAEPGDDQKRVATPRAAIEAGADLLVVGRPLRDAADPVAVASAITADIDEGLRGRG